MHPRGVVLEQRLRHERCGHAVLAGGVLHHVFVHHQIVGHAGKRREAHVDLVLAAGRDLMVMGFDRNPQLFHGQHHFGAEGLHAVGRGHGKISLLRARLVGQIRRFLLAGIPTAFAGIDFVEGVIDALSVAHVVEHEELRLRAEVTCIGKARAPQVGFGLLGDVTAITAIGLTGHGVPDVADQDQGRCRGIRVEEGRGRVRHDQHVAFLNFLEAADR